MKRSNREENRDFYAFLSFFVFHRVTFFFGATKEKAQRLKGFLALTKYNQFYRYKNMKKIIFSLLSTKT